MKISKHLYKPDRFAYGQEDHIIIFNELLMDALS